MYKRRGRRSNIRRRPRRRARRNLRVQRTRMFNPAPIFTETYAGPTIVVPQGGYGNVLNFNMDYVPQLAQYSNLYQKYRILKAVVLMIPEFPNFDQNQAESNVALSRTAYGQSRIAYAINDSPGLVAPVNELSVLQDNGCRIKQVSHQIKMSCRPVPDTKDSNGNQMTFRNKYLTFQSTNINHYGISFWINQFVSNATGALDNNWVTYVKLTFQLADPK